MGDGNRTAQGTEIVAVVRWLTLTDRPCRLFRMQRLILLALVSHFRRFASRRRSASAVTVLTAPIFIHGGPNGPNKSSWFISNKDAFFDSNLFLLQISRGSRVSVLAVKRALIVPNRRIEEYFHLDPLVSTLPLSRISRHKAERPCVHRL